MSFTSCSKASPERATVAANGLKQVALLVKDAVRFTAVYRDPDGWTGSCAPIQLEIELRTVNDEASGLGLPLPSGGIALFRTHEGRELLVGEAAMPDRAIRQDVELKIASSPATPI